MSQTSTPLSCTAADPFLPSINQDQQLSQTDFEELFGSAAPSQPFFLSNNNNVLDELDFRYQDGAIFPTNSSNLSTTSTPDFTSYNFDQGAPAYPTPGPNSPHPYPLDLRRAYPATSDQQAFSHRLRPIRSQTNNAHIHSAQLAQGYGHRRRSLSTSDKDRIAAVNSISNPTFIRLQAPRARSNTLEDRRRNGLYPQHGRSASQGPALRGKPMNSTSTPYHVYSDSLVGGLLPTPIGTPLNEMTEAQGLSYGTGYNSAGTTGRAIYSEEPLFRHMTRSDELARSRHIIEVGALVVSNRSKLDPRLDPQSPITDRARILEKLGDIEEHLRNKEGEEALPACMMIRVTLSRNMDAEVDVADEVGEGYADGLSEDHTESQCDMHDDHDDNDIMEMLMRENSVHDHEEEGSGTK